MLLLLLNKNIYSLISVFFYVLCFISSVDARERDFAIAEKWSDEGVFANRAYFMPERRPAQLGVDRARETDQGLYRCRVDFKVAQTRNSKVNLTVIGKLHLFDKISYFSLCHVFFMFKLQVQFIFKKFSVCTSVRL